jgi:tRNA-guanine family transglycosylase
MHNLYFYLNLTQQIRDSIDNGTFPQFRERFVSDYVA